MCNKLLGLAASEPPLLVPISTWEVSSEAHVTKECHLAATDPVPWALCVIFAAACREIINPTSSTIDEICKHSNVAI